MKRGRPVEFDKTKALNSAMEIFWSNGYEGTSLNDLLDGMLISKSSFYQSYASKEELFLKCLFFYNDKITSHLRQELKKSKSGVKFIEKVFLDTISEINKKKCPRGCLIINSASEFSKKNAKISKAVEESLCDFENIFYEALEKAKGANEIKKNKKIDQLAWYLVSSMSGMRSMIKAGLDKKKAKHIMKMTMESLI